MSRKIPTYDECYAYSVLKEIFGYNNFTLTDKPDLVDEQNGIGIEVVNAIPQDVFFIRYEYNKTLKEEGFTNNNSHIKELDNNTQEYNDDNWYEYNNHLFKDREIEENEMFELLEQTIERKKKKKVGYKKIDKYGLYMYLRTPSRYIKEEFVKRLISIQNSFKDNFQTMYFYVLNENIIFEITENTIIECKVNSIKMSKQAIHIQSTYNE